MNPITEQELAIAQRAKEKSKLLRKDGPNSYAVVDNEPNNPIGFEIVKLTLEQAAERIDAPRFRHSADPADWWKNL